MKDAAHILDLYTIKEIIWDKKANLDYALSSISLYITTETVFPPTILPVLQIVNIHAVTSAFPFLQKNNE